MNIESDECIRRSDFHICANLKIRTLKLRKNEIVIKRNILIESLN